MAKLSSKATSCSIASWGTAHPQSICACIVGAGDSLAQRVPHLFADADLGGCSEAQRSTFGCRHACRSRFMRCSNVGLNQRQGCVPHSTPEAEMVALCFSMRTVGLPYLTLWRTIMEHHRPLVVHEDSQAMIRVVQTGKDPPMWYLGRTHRISVAWLHEVFHDPPH